MLKEEKETVIRFDESPDKATLFTYNGALIRKMDSYMLSHPDDVECIRRDNIECLESVTYRIPKRWIKVSPPRQVSEENRKKSAERLKAYQAQKKCNITD